ncbi:hypothetical protein Patl1_21010 [Pistacia atlantica]|uniref:Uncharacterized protein n=1 Tax=Pistacia atlantica TaxID=434234 RepID=A0ACC1BNA2_9ROSI|nr:hypothetical protein Patl1_21010 [Pistacia atlantica]
MEFKNSREGVILRVLRDAPPSHYLLKINSFSSFSNINKFISENFDAGGFQWKLFLYPNGDKENHGKGHISVYLELAEMSSLSIGWEINVIFNFFVFDQLQDKYVTMQGSLFLWENKAFPFNEDRMGLFQILGPGNLL